MVQVYNDVKNIAKWTLHIKLDFLLELYESDEPDEPCKKMKALTDY